MIELLSSKSGITKFQILIEVAAHQPNVRQKEIAEKIGVTPQAVSEYIKELVAEGLVSSEGRVRYRITKQGVEWVLENAAEMKRYARFVMSDIISHVSTWTAITEEDMNADQEVYLTMRNGLLYVSTQNITNATGTTISAALKGEDVGVTDLMGLIDLENASITVCKIPRVERGGSKNVDLERLENLVRSKSYIATIGVESLIALRRVGREPHVMFGAKESVIEAAFHGLSSLVLAIDEEVPGILSRLESENLEYELVDLSLH
ncbi:putative transcriptional regulator [Methanomethylovorans hollandica DSM 15978]|jgi:putative transcriptional regulator|uniref:Putative transcriptional regulator n=1 Tax=Methanomethylovorans hollandica (strain DSM 15978 / NBRC 107637 / DMS1) TaxID=867904 RepID=L0KTD9_METHD|nr:MarR family transcriptional regulator [Methanomethylovorans hollandica]AGB48702.1 putative transcriptional regulator [Methanomethylovorans hollandica DSM 15978]